MNPTAACSGSRPAVTFGQLSNTQRIALGSVTRDPQDIIRWAIECNPKNREEKAAASQAAVAMLRANPDANSLLGIYRLMTSCAPEPNQEVFQAYLEAVAKRVHTPQFDDRSGHYVEEQVLNKAIETGKRLSAIV